MKLSPELEKRCLELAGLAPDAKGGTGKRGKPALLPASHALLACGDAFVVPYEARSESNERGQWKKTGRVIAARRAVSRALGPHLRVLAGYAEHYAAGGTLRVVFTRLGGRKLDRSNLSVSQKAVEDALCLMLGTDDGDPRWDADWEQSPGAGPCGVGIVLERL